MRCIKSLRLIGNVWIVGGRNEMKRAGYAAYFRSVTMLFISIIARN